MEEKRFYFALSFPDENREFAQAVAEKLAQFVTRDRVFYDKWYEPDLAGRSGDLKLQEYFKNAYMILPFFSRHYDKRWCRMEWDVIRGIMQEQVKDRAVIPIRFDDTAIPGWNSVDFDMRVQDRKPEQIADVVLKAFDDRFPGKRRPNPPSPLPKPALKWRTILGIAFWLLAPASIVLVIAVGLMGWPGSAGTARKPTESTIPARPAGTETAATQGSSEDRSGLNSEAPRLIKPLKEGSRLQSTFESHFELTFLQREALGLTTITPIQVPKQAVPWYVCERDGVRKMDRVEMWAEGQYRVQCWLDVSLGRPKRWRSKQEDGGKFPEIFYKDVDVIKSAPFISVPFSEDGRIKAPGPNYSGAT